MQCRESPLLRKASAWSLTGQARPSHQPVRAALRANSFSQHRNPSSAQQTVVYGYSARGHVRHQSKDGAHGDGFTVSDFTQGNQRLWITTGSRCFQSGAIRGRAAGAFFSRGSCDLQFRKGCCDRPVGFAVAGEDSILRVECHLPDASCAGLLHPLDDLFGGVEG